MAKKLVISSSWKFDSLDELTKFVKKFDAIQELFFPYNTLDTHIGFNSKSEPVYHAVIVNKKPQIKGVGNIDGNEAVPGSYDSVSFMKQAESNQSPSKTSYMTRMKKTKLEKK